MTDKPRPKPAKKGKDTREDRLKKALKANLQRRKQQARARTSAEDEQGE